jgi:hypothetical protein
MNTYKNKPDEMLQKIGKKYESLEKELEKYSKKLMTYSQANCIYLPLIFQEDG